mgnify:CR=1 FL=1
MRPGGRLKPHYGNGPRLTTHLGLIVPPGPVMDVGPEIFRWHEGRTNVFDDTYVHRVAPDRSASPYILLLSMCPPCVIPAMFASPDTPDRGNTTP